MSQKEPEELPRSTKIIIYVFLGLWLLLWLGVCYATGIFG